MTRWEEKKKLFFSPSKHTALQLAMAYSFQEFNGVLSVFLSVNLRANLLATLWKLAGESERSAFGDTGNPILRDRTGKINWQQLKVDS